MAVADTRAISIPWPRRMLVRCRCALQPRVLRTNLLIAVTVGIVLSAANQFDALRDGVFSERLLAKIAFNFVVPFLVSTLGVIMNSHTLKDGEGRP